MTVTHSIFKQRGLTTTESIVALAFTAAVALGVYKLTTDPILADMVSASAPSEQKAYRTLDEQGMKNINIEGSTYIGCATDDTVGFNFNATNGNGKTVRGIVCMDWTKGSTIRYR